MDTTKKIWVFIEQENGKILDSSLEVLGIAAKLAADIGSFAEALLLGAVNAGEAERLLGAGASTVILAEDDILNDRKTRPYTDAIEQLVKQFDPYIVLYSATPFGREMAPSVMARLNVGLTADAIDLGFDSDGDFYMTTPGFSGNIEAQICIRGCRPLMSTVRPGIYGVPDICSVENPEEKIRRVSVNVKADDEYEVISISPRTDNAEKISDATRVISIGRGVKSAAGREMAQQLADAIHGMVGCSRPVVENELLPQHRQIGQSGSIINADFVFNIGISGASQYVAAMQDSKLILSLNNDKNARIFQFSHYGIVGDCETLLPKIVKEINKRIEK